MSYILDALKKADAERERGGVPGLHSQPQAPDPGNDDDDDAPRGQTLPIVWIGAGAALCLIAVLSWQLLKKDAEAPSARMDSTAQPQPQPQQQVAGQAPAPSAETVPVQTHEAPPPPVPVNDGDIARPAVPSPVSPPPAPPRAQAPTATIATPPLRPPSGDMTGGANATGGANGATAPNGAVATSPPAPMTSTANQGTRADTAAASSANQAGGQRIPALNELPEDVRRQIPQITVGGAMYSETPSQRMLIINSQVFREGDQPYQGLVLEEIRLKSAVFKYRGQRYSVNY